MNLTQSAIVRLALDVADFNQTEVWDLEVRKDLSVRYVELLNSLTHADQIQQYLAPMLGISMLIEDKYGEATVATTVSDILNDTLRFESRGPRIIKRDYRPGNNPWQQYFPESQRRGLDDVFDEEVSK